MSQNHYFLPDHPSLREVYSKNDLRILLQNGELSRSDMVLDDETGKAHFLGDLLAIPYSEINRVPQHDGDENPVVSTPRSLEFRADTPLPRPETSLPDDSDEIDEWSDDDEMEDAPAVDEWQPSRDRSPLRMDDELYYIGHPSWFAYPKSILFFIIFIGGAVFSYQSQYGIEWVTLLSSIAALSLVFVSLDRTTTTYYITRRRVEVEFGIIGRNSREARISDIRAIDVYQKGLSAFFGMGTIDFDTAANPGTEVRFINVNRPHDIKQLVRQLQV